MSGQDDAQIQFYLAQNAQLRRETNQHISTIATLASKIEAAIAVEQDPAQKSELIAMLADARSELEQNPPEPEPSANKH